VAVYSDCQRLYPVSNTAEKLYANARGAVVAENSIRAVWRIGDARGAQL